MRISKVKIKRSIAIFAFLSIASILITSCKEDKNSEPEIVPAQTGIRLVHSSFMSSNSLLDLYVDNAKVNSASVAFPGNSNYSSLGSGNKRITVKTSTGTTIKDTTLSVKDGHQYSIFVKEWQKGESDNSTPPILTLTQVKNVVISDDNNTSVPQPGTAKVRFVNASTTGPSLSSPSSPAAIFLKVNAPGSSALTDFLTYNLTDIPSDFLTLNAGPITFRATVLNTLGTAITVNMPEITLQAGKLYILYITGTPGGNTVPANTVVQSTLELKVIAIN
jgi:hypothetical protein